MIVQDHNKRSSEEYQNSTAIPSDAYNNKKLKNSTSEDSSIHHPLQSDDSPYAGKSRTIYLGNVPDGVKPGEILQTIKFGPVENVRLLDGRRCAFIDFCNIQTAIDFYKLATGGGIDMKSFTAIKTDNNLVNGNDIAIPEGSNPPIFNSNPIDSVTEGSNPHFGSINANNANNPMAFRRFIIRGHELRIGWGKPSHLSDSLKLAIDNGASRIVYYKGPLNKEQLEILFELFGPLESVRLIPDKSIAFIQMCSIQNAIEAISVLSGEGHKVNFAHEGKKIYPSLPNHNHDAGHSNQNGNPDEVEDGMIPDGSSKNDNQNSKQQQNQKPSSLSIPHLHPPSNQETEEKEASTSQLGTEESIRNNRDKRTVYLGLLPPDTTEEELCDIIRGGQLQSIRISQDKRSAFVTFIDSIGANSFYQFSLAFGVSIKGGMPLKLGWGKPTSPSPSLIRVLQRGATRNVYLGNLDLSRFTIERLKIEFSSHGGTIESINILKEKNVAFINFTDIMDAVRTVDSIKKDSKLWAEVKIGYGRDRCAQLLRSPTPLLSSFNSSFVPVPISNSSLSFNFPGGNVNSNIGTGVAGMNVATGNAISSNFAFSPFYGHGYGTFPPQTLAYPHHTLAFHHPSNSLSSLVGMGGLVGGNGMSSIPSSMNATSATSGGVGVGGNIPHSSPSFFYYNPLASSSSSSSSTNSSSSHMHNISNSNANGGANASLYTPYVPQSVDKSLSSIPSGSNSSSNPLYHHYQSRPSVANLPSSHSQSSLYYLPTNGGDGSNFSSLNVANEKSKNPLV